MIRSEKLYVIFKPKKHMIRSEKLYVIFKLDNPKETYDPFGKALCYI